MLFHVIPEVSRRPTDVLTYTGSLALEPIAVVTVIALNVQGQAQFGGGFVATTRMNAREHKRLDSVYRSLVKSQRFVCGAFVATTRINARKQKRLDSVYRCLVQSERLS